MEIILVALVALAALTFFSTRRQRRELRVTQDLQASLQAGDEVMTTSGLYGTVVGLTDTTVDLEVAYEVVTTWNRAVVRERVTTDAAEGDAPSEVTTADEASDDTPVELDSTGSRASDTAGPRLSKD